MHKRIEKYFLSNINKDNIVPIVHDIVHEKVIVNKEELESVYYAFGILEDEGETATDIVAAYYALCTYIVENKLEKKGEFHCFCDETFFPTAHKGIEKALELRHMLKKTEKMLLNFAGSNKW